MLRRPNPTVNTERRQDAPRNLHPASCILFPGGGTGWLPPVRLRLRLVVDDRLDAFEHTGIQSVARILVHHIRAYLDPGISPRERPADEVEAAKEGILRGLRMDMESPAARCALDVGEVLDRGRRFDLEATRAELEAVTADTVADVAMQVLRLDRMASAVCSPAGFVARVA